MDGVGRVGIGAVSDRDTAVEGARPRKRDSLFLSARVRLANQQAVFDARVRNLSEGGLMIELDQFAEPGTTVMLDIRGLGEITGTIAWCTHGRLGIALDQPIDPSRARKPVGATKSVSGLAKPLVVPSRRS